MLCLQGDIIKHAADYPLQIRIACMTLFWSSINFEIRKCFREQGLGSEHEELLVSLGRLR